VLAADMLDAECHMGFTMDPSALGESSKKRHAKEIHAPKMCKNS